MDMRRKDNFLPGTLGGERYKKSPELVKEFERRSPPFMAPTATSYSSDGTSSGKPMTPPWVN